MNMDNNNLENGIGSESLGAVETPVNAEPINNETVNNGFDFFYNNLENYLKTGKPITLIDKKLQY